MLPEAVLAAAEAAGEQLPEWHRQLLELGLAASSLDTLVELVEQAIVAPEYIAYVIHVQREKHKAGKLKSLPGAVFAAVTKRHLLAEFETQRARVVPPSTRIIRSRPAALPRRDKLLNELEDAHTSLRFVRTATSYTEEARVIAVAEVEARIAQVEAQLRVVE